VVKKYSLETNTVDFIGHAVALYTNDDFLEGHYSDCVSKIQLYMSSIDRYGPSPFIYPIWGLSGIAEGFSRLCALYGGTYMLNRDCDEILLNDQGKFIGIKSQGEVAHGKILIADPSYFLKYNKVQSKGKVIRCICILDHAVPNILDLPAAQIILPQRQINRKNDIFIAVLNSSHGVCKKGYTIAIISTMVETSKPTDELKPAFDLLTNGGKEKAPCETFITISDLWEPKEKSFSDNCFISTSFDPLSHFEQDTNNIIDLYRKMTGKDIDLNIDDEGEEKNK